MSRDYRILVLGDRNVGKTALINTFLKDVPYIPEASSSKSSLQAASSVLPVVSSPALHGGTLYIVDSTDASDGEDKSSLNLPSWHQHELDRAHAVILVCSTENIEDFEASARRWLGAIRSSASSSKRRSDRTTPVVIAASKSDLTHNTSEGADKAATIQKAFPEVEAIVACSAVSNLNVAEGFRTDLSHSFWHAQQAIESPLHPLYDAEKKHLRPQASQAFSRIFALLARQDKHLRPAAIQELQYRVFHQHITASEIDLLIRHNTVLVNANDESSDIEQTRLSKQDFEAFICALLARNRAEPVWRILRFYGYTTQLNLSKSYLHPKLAISSDGSECVELSQDGLDFVAKQWEDFETSASTDDTISLHGFMQVVEVQTDVIPRLTSVASLEAFIGRWQALASTDTSGLLVTLARLGYPQAEAIETIQTPKKGQSPHRNVLGAIKTIKKDKASRKVFTALVYGNAQSRNDLANIAGDVVSLGGGSYFVLLPVDDASQLSTKRLNQVDLAIYAYTNSDTTDRPSSIDFLVSIRETAPQKLVDLPGLVVGLTSAEHGNEKQESSVSKEVVAPMANQEAVDFCTASRLGAPLEATSLEPLRIELARRASTRRHTKDGSNGTASWLLWSSALLAGVAAGYVLLQRTGWLVSAQRYLQDRT